MSRQRSTPDSGVPGSSSRAASHAGAPCCEHGNRLLRELPRGVLAWRYPHCPCCSQRRGGFHPGRPLEHPLAGPAGQAQPEK